MKYKFSINLAILLMVFCSGYAQFGEEPARTTDYNNIKMPESPTSASIGNIDDLTVNTATGIPSITIPLYTFEMDGVSVPITISYNASGIKVGDLATSVGLNWSLEAGGQISRTVRGKADDFEGWFDFDYTFLSDGYFDSYDPNNPLPWQRDMKGNYDIGLEGQAKLHDHMPDQFSYSFLGHSGTFIHTPNGDVIKEKTDGIKIMGWEETEDLHGNTFQFAGYEERSNNKNTYAINADLTSDFFDWEQQNGNTPITAWKLSKIITKNGKEIIFDYESVDFNYLVPRSESNISIGYSCSNDPQPEPVRNFGFTRTEYFFNTQLIKKISSPDGNIEVTFSYGTDPNQPNGVWETKLNVITITDRTDINEPKIREFHFEYDRYDGDPRLRLDEVYEIWYNNNQPIEKPHYFFTYKEGSLEEKASFKQDFFGYHNNSPGSIGSLVPKIDGILYPFDDYYDDNSRDRSLNVDFVDIGILEEIEYPTGGKTVLTYEPNSLDVSGSNIAKYMGGLRIKIVEQVDRSQIITRKTYEYEELYGFSMEHNLNLISKLEGGNTRTYYSSFVSTPGNILDNYKSGYFYGKVAITTTDPNSPVSFKEEHFYEQNVDALHKFDYALKEKRFYKNGSILPIKIEEYRNEIIGTQTNFTWNILGNMMCYTYNVTQDVSLGHNNNEIKVDYTGDYAFLPTRIATTDFLKQGMGTDTLTVLKYITYDGETLLKTKEIIDNQTTRYENGTTVSYPITDNKAEIITTDYQYPWSENIELSGLPAALPISKIVHSNKHVGLDEIFGQYFEYDAQGNIKRIYQYNKGEAGAINPPTYVDPDYEYVASYLFSNGKPIQVTPKNGVPTSYVWGFKGQLPVAKIEGRQRQGINTTTLSEVENATYANLPAKLNALRADPYLAGAMVTTYTYYPLYGVKTITDPKGDTITYHYDDLGRLEYVTDKEGKRLTENEYNYRPQQ